MKPQLLKVSTGPTRSFSVRQDQSPNINNRWHFHSEVELIQFHKGTGTQFVGDNIKRFGPGDVVLVGANLPHYWRYDEQELPDNQNLQPYATVIHFTEDFWGDRFLTLPETKPIKQVLEKAKRGILLTGADRALIGSKIETLYQLEGAYQLIALLDCLLAIAQAKEVELLSSLGFEYDFADAENERINAIYEFTFREFKQKIRLDDVASVAGLSPNSFCRYFKSRTGKTYSEFLTEIRVGHACRQLIDNRRSIQQICYESGFQNATCFFEKFKAVTGQSPLSYQRFHRNNL
ncbi:helix-turn-helix domain-containing protein [Spirosoma sp. KCTC 42546]|uniref:AraC family transcriptional regulator n=1 Tax=Spirosoma sp. KCTC 42546 TaxID=2520506 RepID=UPI00115A9317|nr:AraC family transcriptional regulator [Spirosoma sp. KCTC 42546]QDK81793.1 helix-turn-helix domain-containing protein [Spirosoma sp. KCTC 42546]